MRNTKLSRSKEQVINKVLGSIQSFIDDHKIVDEETLKSVCSELEFTISVCKAIRDVDRTRKLNQVVCFYFGEDTVEDLLTRQDD